VPPASGAAARPFVSPPDIADDNVDAGADRSFSGERRVVTNDEPALERVHLDVRHPVDRSRSRYNL